MTFTLTDTMAAAAPGIATRAAPRADAPETPSALEALEAPDPHAPLGSRLRLTLALVSRGYSPTQIAALRGVGVADVVIDLRRAVDLLDVQTVREAITAAARRGLLV